MEEHPPSTRMVLGLLSVNRFCIFKVQTNKQDINLLILFGYGEEIQTDRRDY